VSCHVAQDWVRWPPLAVPCGTGILKWPAVVVPCGIGLDEVAL
jgi:hypothetical protein